MTDRPPGPPLWLELVAYTLVALIGIVPALPAGHVVGDGVDMFGTLWFYWWIQDCLLNLRDPGYTQLFFFPLGKDIFAHTGNNFVDAIFAMPFVWIFGIPGFQKVFVVAMMVANALTFRVLARGQLRSGWAVFAACLAWEMNPYVVFEITCGRLTQAFLPFLPLALHHMVKMEDTPGWKHPALAGLFTALQAWTYWFMGWFMAFAYGWLAARALWRSPARRALILRYALAGATCFAAIAPAVLSMARAASSGEVPGLSEGGLDLLSAPGQLGNNVAATLHGYLLLEEEGSPMLGYVSWGGLALVWAAVGRLRARWLPVGLLLLVMAMGPVIPTDGEPIVLPHYMLAYHLLPFFDRLWFPYRMLVIVMAVLALGAGDVLERALAWKPRLARWTPALLLGWATLTGVEQARYGVYPFVARDLTVPATFRWIAEERGALLHLPFGITQPAIVWQTIHHQPLFGGMGENAPLLWPEGFNNRLRNSFVRALIAAARHPGPPEVYNAGQRERLQQEGFRWVVLHRDLVEADIYKWARGRDLPEQERDQAGLDATRTLVELLGPPTALEGPIVTWDLWHESEAPPALRPTEAALYERTWSAPPMPAYEKILREKGRLPGQVAP
ncbi:MAG: hypothetical protein H6739_04270 [Alphaproteobacteria bacterium]|nr:hypothetical protein [Alphaproteobacteria bacterium]